MTESNSTASKITRRGFLKILAAIPAVAAMAPMLEILNAPTIAAAPEIESDASFFVNGIDCDCISLSRGATYETYEHQALCSSTRTVYRGQRKISLSGEVLADERTDWFALIDNAEKIEIRMRLPNQRLVSVRGRLTEVTSGGDFSSIRFSMFVESAGDFVFGYVG